MAFAVEQEQNVESGQNKRLTALSIAFIGALGAAMLSSMMGSAAWAMGFGVIGICCMAMFIVSLKPTQ